MADKPALNEAADRCGAAIATGDWLAWVRVSEVGTSGAVESIAQRGGGCGGSEYWRR